MSAIIEKVLRGGLVDKSTAELMERWGYLEPGASEKVNEDALKNATAEHLNKFAEELATEVDKEHHLRETHLDLERIRWPATISVFREADGDSKAIATDLPAVMDRMGRFYFRIDDVEQDWFVPGYTVYRKVKGVLTKTTILEKQVLYIGETPVCLQVATTES